MIGKIRCEKNGEKARAAVIWAKDHGATWFDSENPPRPEYIAGVFINGADLSYTKDYNEFQNAPEPDITAQVFENSQDAKQDAGKPRLTLVPMSIVWDIAKVREYGCKKYPDGGVDNWRQVAPERYREAAFRHFLRYLDDPQGVDEESGLPHRWHLETNLAFLAALEGEKHD